MLDINFPWYDCFAFHNLSVILIKGKPLCNSYFCCLFMYIYIVVLNYIFVFDRKPVNFL